MRIVTYLIEYLCEFEFIFKTVLGYVSGDQMGYFEAKKTESKISCLGTFKVRSKVIGVNRYSNNATLNLSLLHNALSEHSKVIEFLTLSLFIHRSSYLVLKLPLCPCLSC
jgi:hypothetical protein